MPALPPHTPRGPTILFWRMNGRCRVARASCLFSLGLCIMESRMTRFQVSLGLAIVGVLAGALFLGTSALTFAGDDTAAPKFSTFASAADLAAEVKFLVADLEKAVAEEDEYKSQVEDRFVRDGNTITLIAIALGLHDQASPMKPHAKAIAAAARKLAAAKDYAATKQAVDDLKAAISGKGAASTGELQWGKVAKLNGLMKNEVPNINTKLKNSLRRFTKRAAEVSANAATMALIAENAKLYVADTKKPEEGKKWLAFAAQMQAAACDVAAKAHAGDDTGAKAAMEDLDKSCHDCHAVFNPEKQAVNPEK